MEDNNVSASTTQGGLTVEQAKRKADREAKEAFLAEERRINELPFAELNTDQKFARLASYIRGMDYWRSTVHRLERDIERLKNHSHNGSEVVIPIDFYGNNSVSSGLAVSNKHPLD